MHFNIIIDHIYSYFLLEELLRASTNYPSVSCLFLNKHYLIIYKTIFE